MMLRFSAANFPSSEPAASGSSYPAPALRTMADFVLRSTSFSASDYDRYYPTQSGGDRQPKPILFEIELLLHASRFRYAFSYDSRRITFERLLVIDGIRANTWFERSYHAETLTEAWAPFSRELTGPHQMWRDATRPEALFLSTAGSLHAMQLAPLILWFEKGDVMCKVTDT